MEIPLLPDIVTIFSLSILVLLICHRLFLPAIVGFIITGILCGPNGLALVKAESEVQTLAQLGIIFLLFSVGMEFSFKKILEAKRYFLLGGSLQVGLTVALGFVIGIIFSRPLGEAIFLGFILSLSSTAIVVRLLEEKRETDSPHGHMIMGIMIFQDIVAIPMLLIIPMLSGSAQEFDHNSLILLVEGLAILFVVLFSAVKFVPSLLHHIAKTGSRELFLFSVFTICFTVAWVTASVGLSLSLGAFLAGLTISDTEYRTEAISDILPFQDIFTSLFFVSIGMLLDVAFVWQQWWIILIAAMSVLFLKGFVASLTAFVLGMPLRTTVMTGLALCQIGEFSFVLAKSGVSLGLSDSYHYQLFLAVSLLTMGVTPTLISLSPKLAEKLLLWPLPLWMKSGHKTANENEQPAKRNHVVIIGYGISGRNLARSAKEANLPYVIIDMNAETVKKERLRGEPIYFGDATHEHVLHHVNISEARVIAIVINDYFAAQRIVEKARKLNQNLFILVRTRYLKEMKSMIQSGADEVIPDEFGSSVEIFIRVLNKYHIPKDEVQKIVSAVRVEGYEMCRLLYKEPTTLSDLKIALSDVMIETFRVGEGSAIAGKTLGEIELRKNFGVNAMLVQRGEETIKMLDSHTRLLSHNVVVVCGTHDFLAHLPEIFKPVPQDS